MDRRLEDRKVFEQRKEMVRDMIYDASYVPLKFKEMAYLMRVPHHEKEKLREVLDSLVTEGSVELTARGKYVRASSENRIGVFTANARGFGFVSVEGEAEDIFIPAPYVNGAFHKDRVRVKVSGDGHGKERGRKEGDRREHARKGSGAKEGRRKEGVIVSILERGTKTLVGTFMQGKSFGFVRPDDIHYGQDIFIPGKSCGGARNKDKVVVTLTGYGERNKKPEGRVTEIIGNADDPSADITSIVRAYGIPDTFSGEVMREARAVPDTVDARAALKDGKRKDYRSLLTVTIDGEDAKDLDDAITVGRRGDGYVLGVHIADVSHYVREGEPLDKEALARGTSVYLCDRVIPMLPRELSNGICSLNAGVDRLALSCVMELDARGNVLGHEIVESLICVDRRMSYTGVKTILEGQSHPEGEREDIRELCFLMREVAAVLKEKRRKRGAIDFDFPESKIILDKEGYPTDIHPYERNVATDIIEDFMLLANETVAEDYFWQELPFVYRTHEEPDSDKIARLDTFIRNFGFYMKTGREHFHPKEIQKLLFSLEGEPEEALISRLALRSMKQARYTTLNVGHFGLSTQYYTHFTSPIRRYPDLQIHRIIKENIHGRLQTKRVEHYESILPAVAEQSSRLERRAQDAEREVEKLKKVEYMQKRIGDVFDGVISGVTAKGFFVELSNTVEGMVSIQTLLDDYYFFDEGQYRLEGKRTGRIFTLGQKVRVVMEAASKITKTIDFLLEEFSAHEGWDAHGATYAARGEESWSEEDSRGDTPVSGEMYYDAPEEEWYSDDEEGWIESKDDIARNDWLDDEEAENLLKLYEKKSVRDI